MNEYLLIGGFHVPIRRGNEPGNPNTIVRMGESAPVDSELAKKFAAHRANAIKQFTDGVADAANSNAPVGATSGPEWDALIEKLKAAGFDTSALPEGSGTVFLQAILDAITEAMKPPGKEPNPPGQQTPPQPGPNGMFMEGRTRTLSPDKRRSILEGTEMGRQILEREKRAARSASKFSDGGGLSRAAVEGLSGTPAGRKRLRSLGVPTSDVA